MEMISFLQLPKVVLLFLHPTFFFFFLYNDLLWFNHGLLFNWPTDVMCASGHSGGAKL